MAQSTRVEPFRPSGTGAATNSFDDIERAKTILVCGSNETSCHPIVGARIRRAAWRGAKLIVLDTRRTELAAIADVHPAPRPGTDLLLFHAMANVVLEEGLVDQAFIDARVDGLEDFRTHVRRFSHGTVKLEGIVSYSSQRADAERAIERLSGVKRVINQIEVRPSEDVDVSEAHRAVVKALERHAERDASRIAVHAENGTVNITGVVHTLEEKAAVLGAVRGTRGVRDIADRLRVDPADPES
jgi:anaerobic selenocysteine-containing dehydrogenase